MHHIITNPNSLLLTFFDSSPFITSGSLWRVCWWQQQYKEVTHVA
jgi:hypothetical protein